MSYMFGSGDTTDSIGADVTATAGKAADGELQEFLLIERQKAMMNAKIHEFNDLCWDRCVEKPSTKLDSRTETCLQNCVDRFIDVSLLIRNRFAQLIQKSAGGSGGF